MTKHSEAVKPLPTIETIAVIAKLSNSEYRQIILSNSQIEKVLSYIEKCAHGEILVSTERLYGCTIEQPNL